jgi:hypothetical protein
MVAFIQKAHGCIYFCYAIEAQAAQLAISDRSLSLSLLLLLSLSLSLPLLLPLLLLLLLSLSLLLSLLLILSLSLSLLVLLSLLLLLSFFCRCCCYCCCRCCLASHSKLPGAKVFGRGQLPFDCGGNQPDKHVVPLSVGSFWIFLSPIKVLQPFSLVVCCCLMIQYHYRGGSTGRLSGRARFHVWIPCRLKFTFFFEDCMRYAKQ